jgi:hypothetical protein
MPRKKQKEVQKSNFNYNDDDFYSEITISKAEEIEEFDEF